MSPNAPGLGVGELKICSTVGSRPATRVWHAFCRRMDSDPDPTTNKPLEKSMHAIEKAPDKKDLLHRIGIYLSSGEGVVGAEVLRLLRDIDAHIRAEANPTAATATTANLDTKNIQKTLRTMQDSLDRIEKGGQAVNTAGRASYAEMAAQGRGKATGGRTEPSEMEVLKEKRKAKEVTIRIEDPKEVVELKGKSSKDILQAAQSAGVEVTGIRRLPSGDIRFHTRSQDTKDTLQANTEWTKVVAASAKVQQQTYTVIVHGVRVKNVNTAHQNGTITSLKRANVHLHSGLDIKRVSWPTKAIRLGKVWSSLYVEVATAEMANRLITEGFIEDYENKECELFSKDCQITQCFNCHQYGHVGKACRNQTRCGHCAHAHSSHACPVAGSARSCRCVVCKKEGHEAWSPDCEVRKIQKRRVQTAYELRPRFYPVVPRQNTPNPEPLNILSNDPADTAMESCEEAPEATETTRTNSNAKISAAHIHPSTQQLLREFAMPTPMDTQPTANVTSDWANGKPQDTTATAKKSVRRSRSASPTTRDLSLSPNRQPRVRDWKDTIMNPDNQLREKAYAKPARGRPKKIILASTIEDEDSTL